MIKISIIIPVYNVEKYLDKCIFSCVNQTLEEIEVIVINDASPDACNSIMNKYQREYPNKIINIFLDKNLRQGGARNKGIKIARGEYLCFVDGDDYIAYDTCEKLYAFAQERDLDIACCDGYRIKDGNFEYHEKLKLWDMTSKQSLNNFTSQCYMIIKKSIIVDNNLLYPEHIFHEDTSVVPLWYVCASKKDILNQPLFYINKHSDSSSVSAKGIDNIQILVALEELVRNAKRIRKYSENRAAIDCFIFERILTLAKRMKKITLSENEEKLMADKLSIWAQYDFDESLFYRFFTKMEYETGKQFLMNNTITLYKKSEIKVKNIYCDKKGNIKGLLEYVSNELRKTVIIWGVGGKGINVISTIKNMGYNYIVGDNNSDLWGKVLSTGDVVRDPQWIKKNTKKPFYLITVKRAFKPICRELCLMDNEAIDFITFMEQGLSVENIIGNSCAKHTKGGEL